MRSLRVLLAFAATAFAVLPASAAGQTQEFGSPLAAAPNLGEFIRCENAPVFNQFTFEYQLGPSGAPDCTWRQQGVFGSPPGDTRYSSVPGDGRIIGAVVKSGSSPAPLRFVVISQLASPGGGGTDTCCVFARETQPMQPAPDTLTPFALDLPVQRNTINGIQRIDLVGISAASNTGTLPLHSTGNNSLAAYTQFGSVNAGFFYPRVSPADGQNTRYESGIAGVEVLVRWTWCPAGQTCGVSSAPTAGRVRVRNGSALIDLTCGADIVCAGIVELFNRSGGPRLAEQATGGSPLARRKAISYGSARYTIPAGKKKTVKVKLKGKARKVLRRKGKLKVNLTLTPTGGTPIVSKRKLKG